VVEKQKHEIEIKNKSRVCKVMNLHVHHIHSDIRKDVYWLWLF
jgi:hypothetical protein